MRIENVITRNFLLSIFAFGFASHFVGKHVAVSGLLLDSGLLLEMDEDNNDSNNKKSEIDNFKNSFISGSKDNQPMTSARGDYVTDGWTNNSNIKNNNNNNKDNTIRRRQHRHKHSIATNEQHQIKHPDDNSKKENGENKHDKMNYGDDDDDDDDLQLSMLNSQDQHADMKNEYSDKKKINNNSNNNYINYNNNNYYDNDVIESDDNDDGGKLKAKGRKERMKKYWEKRKKFYEKRRQTSKGRSDRYTDSQASKNQQPTGPTTSVIPGAVVLQNGMKKNSIISADGANSRKWRQSVADAKIHNVQYREHLKRQIYNSEDGDEDDDDDNNRSGGDDDDDDDDDDDYPERKRHHHRHHGNGRAGRHERRHCDRRICRNDGICNQRYEVSMVNNVTSLKKCLCRLGTAGQYCERTEVSVKYPKFQGFGFIAFPTLRESYKEFSIRLEFRPEVNYGLLLFSSDHVEASHDFFSVNIIDGRVEFRFDCGTGLGRIRTDNQVELGTWNALEILRRESEAEIRLNSGSTFKGRSKGEYTKMTFRDHLFLGGHKNMTHAARYSGAKSGFVGCMRRLEVKDRNYDMRRGAFVGDALYGLDVEECDGHECERVKCQNGGTCINKEVDSYVCLCRLGNVGKNCERKADVTMPSFSDMSYLQYVGLRRTVLNFLQIEIVFLPRSSTGMLLFNGFSPDGFGDFVSLTLVNSTVEFRFDLGTGPAIIKGRSAISLNEWHSVKAWRDGKNGHLQVDGDMEVTGTSRGAFIQLTLALDLFVGGHRNFDEVTRNAFVSSSFDGCIQKLIINERPIKLVHESLGGVNIGECSAHPCSSKRPCLNGGKCIAILDKYKCDCLPGFQEDHCQERTSRYKFRYKRSSDQGNDPLPKFDGSSYMLITRYDIVSKTRGSSLDLEMRIKAKKGTSGLIFFVSNQIDNNDNNNNNHDNKDNNDDKDNNDKDNNDDKDKDNNTVATNNPTNPATRTTTKSFPQPFSSNHSELFNERKPNFLKSFDDDNDHYFNDDNSDVMKADVFKNTAVKDDDGGYEDYEANEFYHYNARMRNDDDEDDDDVSRDDGAGKTPDFFAVSLIDGFVTVEFSLGEGEQKMTFNRSKVDDGNWHSVRIHRRGRQATLEVDGSEIIKVSCPGRSEQLYTDGTVYIGGLPNINSKTSGRYKSGFHGCIGHISLSSGQLIDLFKMADVASNVSVCQEI